MQPSRWTNVASAAVFVGIAVLAALDAFTDIAEGIPILNVALDLTLVAGALFAGWVFLGRFVELRRQSNELAHHLGVARADAARWRAECVNYMPALGKAIRRQLERWSLTAD